MRQGTVILQSCTVVPASCSCTCVTASDDACEEISVKAEEDSGVTMKVEEIPEPVSFSAIKAEPDEVSYLPVCQLLDTCHLHPKMSNVFHVLHLSVCSVKKNSTVLSGNFSLFLACVNL